MFSFDSFVQLAHACSVLERFVLISFFDAAISRKYGALSGCTATAVAGLFCRGCKMDGTLLEFCHHI